jgi:hypothetical protein
MFRHMYVFAETRSFKNLEESAYFTQVIKHRDLLESNFDSTKSYVLLVLYMEVGKFFIKAASSCFITTEELILSGVENYKNTNLSLPFEDALYVKKIYAALDGTLRGNDLNENMLVYKDATASGLQNFGIVLGYRKDRLEHLNLNGNRLCDTYKYIIDRFLDTADESLRKRKYWKGTIMTIPYNSSWFTCFKSFLDSLEEDVKGFRYRELDVDEKTQLINIHRKFYENVKKFIEEEFYTNEFYKIVEFKYNK